MPNIYKMQLHDILMLDDGTRITRVAGGWIYQFEITKFHDAGTVFVPFHNEFMHNT